MQCNYRTSASDRFLPIWEGVSGRVEIFEIYREFPPYMGGCIGQFWLVNAERLVSSLYGRVYRPAATARKIQQCFLPIWEGVSAREVIQDLYCKFPPYMGGCIG